MLANVFALQHIQPMRCSLVRPPKGGEAGVAQGSGTGVDDAVPTEFRIRFLPPTRGTESLKAASAAFIFLCLSIQDGFAPFPQ